MVSSRPGGELKHWGQVIFSFEEVADVAVNDTIRLKLLHSDLSQQVSYTVL
ncbi:MAG: hypothetical protein AAGJ93_02635 [Bacteroidota bacterium]